MSCQLSAILKALSHLYHHFLYLLTIVGFHLCRTILLPVGFIFNCTYLIHHPQQTLPIVIGSLHNTTIHSFFPSPSLFHQLNIPEPPPIRRWCRPEDINKRIAGEIPGTTSVLLQGKVSGPLLRQGMVFIQQEARIFIGEEIGRWEDREDILLTICVNLDTNRTFCLFIPIDYLDRSFIRDECPRSPLRTPFSLIEAVRNSHRISQTSSSTLSPV